MGLLSDGILCYGIDFGEEDDMFPWVEIFFDDIEEWWIYEVCNHTDPTSIKEDREAYHAARDQCLKTLPVELVIHCSDVASMYIIAVKGSVITSNRGYPVSFSSDDLKVTEEQIQALLKFCRDHGIEHDSAPSWILTSYFG